MFLEGEPSIRPGSGIIGTAQTFSRWDLLAGSLSVFHWKRKQRKIFYGCGGIEMAEFQEGTLDTLMERLCSSISGFDPEWVKRCVPATEKQIQQLQDILAEYHYTIPAAYLYYLRRMGQDDGGLLEDEGDEEVDIGTVLELLPGKCEDLKKGLFQFSDHWADACFYMKLSNTEDNPMVTDWGGVYVTESFEKYLFQKAFGKSMIIILVHMRLKQRNHFKSKEILFKNI